MRPILLAALSFLIAAPASAETRNFGIASFTRVRLQGPFRVSLTTGVAPFAKASGSARALQNVDIRIEGETLIVSTNASAWGGYPGNASGPVEVSLGTHDLRLAAINGAGTLDINRVKGLQFTLTIQGAGGASIGQADVDNLVVGIAGTGHATLAGKAKSLDSVLRGLAALDARRLTLRNAKFLIDGASSADATVTDTVTVTGSGNGALAFSGNPACQLKLTGTGMISGCR